MRYSKLILVIITVFILIVCIWFLYRPEPSTHMPILSTERLQTNSVTRTQSETGLPLQRASTTNTQHTGNVISKDQEQGLIQLGNKLVDEAKAMNRPISFYGQIIDETGSPVKGVKIICRIQYYGDSLMKGFEPGIKTLDVISDEQGRFSVEDEKGLSLTVELQSKEGYEFGTSMMKSFDFRGNVAGPVPAVSSPDEPYIFNAHKIGEAEGLIYQGLWIRLKPDMRVYTFDPSLNLYVEGQKQGIQFAIQRPFGAKYTQPFYWKVEIKIPGGGLVESEDPFMYEAPAEGYEPIWSLNMSPANTQIKWADIVRKKFFFKTADGKCGKMEVEIDSVARDETSRVVLSYWLNPSGSRNLRYDESKRIRIRK